MDALNAACARCAAAIQRSDQINLFATTARRLLSEFTNIPEATVAEAVHFLADTIAADRGKADPGWFAASLELLLELSAPSGSLGPEAFGLLSKIRLGVDQSIARGPRERPVQEPSPTQQQVQTPAALPEAAAHEACPPLSQWRTTDVDGEWRSPAHAESTAAHLPHIRLRGDYPRFRLVDGACGRQYLAILRWGHAAATATIISEKHPSPDEALREVIALAAAIPVDDVLANDMVREHFDVEHRPWSVEFENVHPIGVPQIVCRAKFGPSSAMAMRSSVPMPTQRAAFLSMVRIAREKGIPARREGDAVQAESRHNHWRELLAGKGIFKAQPLFKREGADHVSCTISGELPDGSAFAAIGEIRANLTDAFQSAAAIFEHEMRKKHVLDWKDALQKRVNNHLPGLTIFFAERDQRFECVVEWGRGGEHCIASSAHFTKLDAFEEAAKAVNLRVQIETLSRSLREGTLEASGLRAGLIAVEAHIPKWRAERAGLLGSEDPTHLHRLHLLSGFIDLGTPSLRARMAPSEQLAVLGEVLSDLQAAARRETLAIQTTGHQFATDRSLPHHLG